MGFLKSMFSENNDFDFRKKFRLDENDRFINMVPPEYVPPRCRHEKTVREKCLPCEEHVSATLDMFRVLYQDSFNDARDLYKAREIGREEFVPIIRKHIERLSTLIVNSGLSDNAEMLGTVRAFLGDIRYKG